MPRNLKITLAYDGTDFYGWQMQPDLPTIQSVLADSIGRVTGEKVVPQGSGRTDAGVHALAQVASCAIESPIPARNLMTALNDILPAAIRVNLVEEVATHFHARYSALGKRYEYRIFRGEVCPPHLARYVYHHPYPLNEFAMADAANAVAGEHDFTSFAAVDPEKSVPEAGDENSSVRTITHSQWQRTGDEFVYTVAGNGFLHHMVRNLVGTLLLVGKGSLQSQDIRRIIAAKSRSAAGATAPASGLWLVSVQY
jgi:tRNA pseudouridine38-40 synthase